MGDELCNLSSVFGADVTETCMLPIVHWWKHVGDIHVNYQCSMVGMGDGEELSVLDSSDCFSSLLCT